MQLIAVTGEVYPLKVGVNTIGRAEGNDIVLNDGSMSRRHAELYWDGQHCSLTDLGSTNGTFFGGQRLPPHQPQPVSPGVQLSFGPTMAVALAEDAAGAPTTYVSSGGARSSPAAGLDSMFRALDVALDRRILGLALLGFLGAGLVGAVFVWLFAQVAGDSAAISIGLALVGALMLWLVVSFVSATITRLILLELGEGRQASVREAFRYTRQHFLAFFLSPLVLVVGLVLVLLAESVFLLLGRVEYVGELAVSLAFLPLVVLNLAVILVAWFGTAITFPLIADRGGSIGDTVSGVLAFIRQAPGRLVAYMMLAGLISLLMFIFCFYLIFAALYTTSALTLVGMEPAKFLIITGGLPLDVGDLIPGLPYGLFGGLPWREPPVTYTIARFLLALALLGLVMVVLAIPQIFYLASTCAVYLNLRGEVPGRAGRRQGTSGTPQGAHIGSAPGEKVCWLCGAPLARDQTYCPNCKQLQR
jgi:hypothetical protein